MKRYTVCLRPLDTNLSPERVKTQVERDILHSRASFYRLGRASQTAPDKIVLEVASESKPAEVLRYFREREESLAAHVEQIRWGWSITSADKLVTGLAPDPYATAQPQSDENALYTYNRWQPVRYIIHMAMNMAVVIMILLIVFTPFRDYFVPGGRIFNLLNCTLLYYLWILIFG